MVSARLCPPLRIPVPGETMEPGTGKIRGPGDVLLNWCEIDAGAIRWNIDEFRRRLALSSTLGAVVKSNAYGHGMLDVAGLARQAGVEWLCVNSIDEAVELREAGQSGRILVMGYVPLDRLRDVARLDLRPVVYNLETLAGLDEAARETGRPVALHLKLETGTHRQGIAPDEVEAFARQVVASDGLELEGVSTHFANIEDSTDHSFAEQQIGRFTEVADRAQELAGKPLIRHAACSAATLLFTKTHLGMARLGISLYGLWPSRETYVSCLDRGKPALELRPLRGLRLHLARHAPLADRGASRGLPRRIRPWALRSGACAGSWPPGSRPGPCLHEHVHGGRDRRARRGAGGRGGATG